MLTAVPGTKYLVPSTAVLTAVEIPAATSGESNAIPPNENPLRVLSFSDQHFQSEAKYRFNASTLGLS
jgi:hypothetical protein